ncbi:MAG: hypothetical protein P9M03_05815 [Candidatus Theseobacter exili]|nr:hypothetical protein [Candidatus Theseobacter exili]
MKGKIIRDIKNQKKRERPKEDFRKMYNELEQISFLDRYDDTLNVYKFVALPKNIHAYNLSNSALAVYPVLCSKADFVEDKSFQISQENIAFMAGINKNTACKGLEELEAAELLSKEMIIEGARHFYMYNVQFFRKPILEENKGNIIYFYTCIIDNGIWAKLNPRAKALYLAMRITAKQNLDEYNYYEDNEYYETMEYDEYIRNRKWDMCIEPLTVLCNLFGISSDHINMVIKELEKYKLIERMETCTKVYLKPSQLLKHL